MYRFLNIVLFRYFWRSLLICGCIGLLLACSVGAGTPLARAESSSSVVAAPSSDSNGTQADSARAHVRSEVLTEPVRVLVVSANDQRAGLLASSPQTDGLAFFIVDDSPIAYTTRLYEAVRSVSDPERLELLIVSPAPLGTARAFGRLRQDFPALMLVALEPEDPILEIEAAADLVVSSDPLASAYIAVRLAQQKKAARLISVLTAPLPADSVLQLKQTALERIAVASGLEYLQLFIRTGTVRLPPSAPGLSEIDFLARYSIRRRGPLAPGAALEISDQLDSLRNPATAVYAADRSSSPMLQRLALSHNFVMVGGQSAYPLVSEAAIMAAGAAGQLAFPSVPLLVALEEILIALVLQPSVGNSGKTGSNTVAGPAGQAADPGEKWSLPDQSRLQRLLQQRFPEAGWQVEHMLDVKTGVRSRIHLTVQTDCWLPGYGYLSTLAWQVPAQFRF